MTQDEIIAMATKAGFKSSVFNHSTWIKEFEKFAKLVEKHTLSNIDPSKFMSYQEGFEAGRLAEREACAIVCDDINAKYKWPDDVAERVASQWCADSIRARGQA